MTEEQNEITAVVNDYKRLFPGEFALFRKRAKMVRQNQKTSFAEMKGSDYIERAIAEKPETLEAMLLARLSGGAYEYLKTKRGIRWFVKRFKDFAVASRV